MARGLIRSKDRCQRMPKEVNSSRYIINRIKELLGDAKTLEEFLDFHKSEHGEADPQAKQIKLARRRKGH